MPRPVLMLEFNELSPELMHRFITEGHLPNFKRLHDESRVYVTDAQEAQDVLEPWIQWVTVHTGLSYEEHGVFLLGDGPKCSKMRIWDILSRNSRKADLNPDENTVKALTIIDTPEPILVVLVVSLRPRESRVERHLVSERLEADTTSASCVWTVPWWKRFDRIGSMPLRKCARIRIRATPVRPMSWKVNSAS